jgi:hypothetical protein
MRECDSRASRWVLFDDQWRSDDGDEESPSEGESESDEGVHAEEEVCAKARGRSAPEARDDAALGALLGRGRARAEQLFDRGVRVAALLGDLKRERFETFARAVRFERTREQALANAPDPSVDGFRVPPIGS